MAMGRPKGSVTSDRTEAFSFRVSGQQHAAWTVRANGYGHTVAGWARWVCNIATGLAPDWDLMRIARPPSSDADGCNVQVRMTGPERAAWDRAAGKAGLGLSGWIRRQCDLMSGLEPED